MKIIPELPHPEIMGGMLERGARYGHHFVVDLISDGKRLWAVASEEGRKLIAEIEGKAASTEAAIAHHSNPANATSGAQTDALWTDGPTIAEWVEAGYAAVHYPPPGYAARSTPEEIAAAIEAQKASEAVGIQSATGTGAVTNRANPGNANLNVGGEPPTTTVAPGNTFG